LSKRNGNHHRIEQASKRDKERARLERRDAKLARRALRKQGDLLDGELGGASDDRDGHLIFSRFEDGRAQLFPGFSSD
jgi:hypothetical protein